MGMATYLFNFYLYICSVLCMCMSYCVFCVCGVFLCESTELHGIFGLKINLLFIIIINQECIENDLQVKNIMFRRIIQHEQY